MELKTTDKELEAYYEVYKRDISEVKSRNILANFFSDFITLKAENEKLQKRIDATVTCSHFDEAECYMLETGNHLFADFTILKTEVAELTNKEQALIYAVDDLRCTLDAYGRCAESLRAERDTLATELTLTKQHRADTLHELRSAVAVIEMYANCNTWLTPDYVLLRYGHPSDSARNWLTLHARQTKAPIAVDAELEADQAKEAMLEDR